MNAIDHWAEDTSFTIQRYSIERAIKSFVNIGNKIEAMALIRAVYIEEDGGPCTLEHAKFLMKEISEETNA